MTNKLRLRRAARGSGEHRRMECGAGKRCWRSPSTMVSSTLTEAPASQL